MSPQELTSQYLPNAADARESDNGEDGYREAEYMLTGGSEDEDYEEFSDEDDSVGASLAVLSRNAACTCLCYCDSQLSLCTATSASSAAAWS